MIRREQERPAFAIIVVSGTDMATHCRIVPPHSKEETGPVTE